MLIYCNEDGGETSYELVQSIFDSHFKLTLTVSGKVLPAGKYIILVAPEWHQSATLDAQYKSIRLGIYCPVNVNLEKCGVTEGHRAIASCF